MGLICGDRMRVGVGGAMPKRQEGERLALAPEPLHLQIINKVIIGVIMPYSEVAAIMG